MISYALWLMFSWRGRIGKAQFLRAVPIMVIIEILFKVAVPSYYLRPSIPLGLLALTYMWIVCALCAKRLHDLGWSGLLALGVGLGFGILYALRPQPNYESWFVIVVVVVVALALLGFLAFLMIKEGDAGGRLQSAPPRC